MIEPGFIFIRYFQAISLLTAAEDVYAVECTARFLMKYGRRCELEEALWPDTELLDLLRMDKLRGRGAAGWWKGTAL